MQIKENVISAEAFLELYKAVGWETPTIEQMEIALENCLCTFVAVEDDRPVGMVRLLGDRGMAYLIKDFIIHPEYQGRGIGRQLFQHIEEYIQKQLKTGWKVSLDVMSAEGKEGFYKRIGFEKRPNAGKGHGMTKMIRNEEGI